MMGNLKTIVQKLKPYTLSLSFTFCTFIFALFTIQPVYALESTPSASPLRQSDSEGSIKIKLEELKKEIASKAAKIKQEVDRKLKNKAYVGKIKSKSDTSLTLAALSGPKIINITEDTVFGSNLKSKPKYSAKNISLEDYVVSLGDSDETGVLTAKKVILLPNPNTQTRVYLWGQIISISDKLATLKTYGYKSVAVIFPVSSKAKLNDFVILTGTENENDIIEADFVYTIPEEAVLKPKKLSSPSVSTQATPSAKPTVR